MTIKQLLAIGATASCAWTASTLTARADAPASAPAASAPLRSLVYSFQYGVQQDASARDSANQASAAMEGSGITHYTGSLNDSGTMTVQIMREQPDKGLVVIVSEEGKDTRKAPPVICVVYANTTVLCDPNKTVNPEEFTLLRFLSANFIDPSKVDAKQHWNVNEDNANFQVDADYTIDRVDNGIMTIGESRKIKQKGMGATTSDVESKIVYDYGRAVPDSINEYVTQRMDAGMAGTSTTIYQTTLQLLTDSMNKG